MTARRDSCQYYFRKKLLAQVDVSNRASDRVTGCGGGLLISTLVAHLLLGGFCVQRHTAIDFP
jgi:hypothetical protein